MLDIDIIKDAVADVVRAKKPRMALLFGSYARGTATRRSDVDLIFVEETGKRYIERLDDYFIPLSRRLKTGVEVFVYTPDEFESMKDGPFLKRALEEGIGLHES